VTTLLRVRDLAVSFRHESGAVVEAVRGVSFEVPVESTVALVGESGSGKTVSAMAVVGLLPARTARIGPGSAAEFDGRDLLRLPPAELRALRGGQIATVFQEPMTSLNPVVTVGAQIAEVLRLHKRMGRAAARRRAVELLDEVGLPEPARRARSHPHQLSGGQQQRAMIAMGIACEPRLLIADEPTTALDVTTQQQILELLASLRRRHRMSVLFITHDLGIVSDIADQVVVMQRGEVRRPFLGVAARGEDLSPVEAQEARTTRAVRILEVGTGTPAEQAGLAPQDLLLSANGTPVLTLDDLQRVMVLASPPRIELEVLRGHKLLRLAIQPLARPRAA
jgi:peptide/nickel transport system ATP-binding protein